MFRGLLKPFTRQATTISSQQRIASAGKKKTFKNASILLWSFPLGSLIFQIALISKVTLGLGIWQIERLRFKTSTIDAMHKMTTADPVLLSKSDLKEYSRVKVTGHFLHDSEFHVGPRSYDSAPVGGGIFSTETNTGYYIITPFQLTKSNEQDDDRVILVNRGWVMKGKILCYDYDVTVDGWIRKGDKNNSVIPTNEVENNQWYTIDIAAMSTLAQANPILLEMLTTTDKRDFFLRERMPLPRPFDTNIRLRNTHLEYAITWFGMSMVSAYMLYKKR